MSEPLPGTAEYDISRLEAQNAALQAELDARGEPAHRIYILVTEAQATDLASGYVPTSVKAQITTLLEYREEDARRAARPERPSRQRAKNMSG